MARKEGVRRRNGEAPTLARFQPKDEYISTFDMLHDGARNHAYSAAVRLQAKTPSADDENNENGSAPAPLRWLDIGTGSGLLASLVAAASSSSSASVATSRTLATEVYACEGVAEVADVAAETFAKNRGDIRLFRGRSTEMEVGKDLPCRVPRVISELLGTGLLEEGLLPTLRDAQARLLSPGYVSIPDSAEVWAVCCESSEFHSMSRLLPHAADGIGEAFLPPSSEEWERCPGTASPVSARARLRPLSPSVRVFDFGFSAHGDPLPGPEGRKREVRFPIDSGGGGTVHAVVCWWRCFMDEGRTITMSTSPLLPPNNTLDKDAPPENGAPPSEDQLSPVTAPPIRDHWRQSVYLLSRPLQVRAGDTVRALARHDDTTVWFHAVERETHSASAEEGSAAVGASCGAPAAERSPRGKETTADAAATTTPRQPAPVGSASAAPDERVRPSPSTETATAPTQREPGEEGHVMAREVVARDTKDGPVVPPVCVCGFHRTCPPSRIWMLNDQSRTAAFRTVIRSILVGDGYPLAHGPRKQQNISAASNDAAAAAGKKRSRTTPVQACVACISDGFLLPLLVAQEGASDVLEIQPSAAYAAVCRDVYRANGVDVDFAGDGSHSGSGSGNNQKRAVIQPFPGGVSNVYELLMPSPGAAAPDNSNGVSSAGRKLDAVIGEPFFADLSTATWPLEALLLFWCARTALEAGGYFSPRTRVVPARARLLACPLACGLLFGARRPVGNVEGVDMSAVNHRLGVGCAGKPQSGMSGGGDGGGGGENGGEDANEEDKDARLGDAEPVRLSEYEHELLGPPAVVLDMDLTRPLCDLRGGRKEIRCRGRQPPSTTEATEPASQQRGQEAGAAVCHGVALWLDIWLDEEGLHRLSTGPEVPYWPQGVLFFGEEWDVPSCGGSFHLEVALQDGALSVGVS